MQQSVAVVINVVTAYSRVTVGGCSVEYEYKGIVLLHIAP